MKSRASASGMTAQISPETVDRHPVRSPAHPPYPFPPGHPCEGGRDRTCSGLISQDAEYAVKELQKSGYDMKKLSLVGKDYHTEENVIGYYNAGDRIATWGKFGVFWGTIWGLLFGSAFFIIPGLGPVMVAGPLVSWIVGVLETALVTGGITALGGVRHLDVLEDQLGGARGRGSCRACPPSCPRGSR